MEPPFKEISNDRPGDISAEQTSPIFIEPVMASQDSEVEDAAHIASLGERDTRHQSAENSPLPTDSMVSVRLSDALGISPPDIHSPENTPLPDSVRNTVEAFEPASPTGLAAVAGDNSALDNFSDTFTESEEYRTSTISLTSIQREESLTSALSTVRSRSDSSETLSSHGSAQVDWDELEKSEEQAPRDEGSDESTAFLLARLEQENNALAIDPKAKLARARSTRKGTKARPPSIQQLKKLVNEPAGPSLRYSLIPEPPPMTELEFWAALVNDYPQTAQRLPTLTSNKIRSGVPPPLRGVVWMSIAGSQDKLLEEEYDRLCGESSPYENLIGKDIGRSFPGVEMFRDPSGDGQQMLGRVLKCFSLYDLKIGYCQGLGFVVGPLLMHMGDKEAFCVLVRLMEHYDLRSCFLPDLSGLHLRIYQFQKLLSKHHPVLTNHLGRIGVEPLYVSQWFLSFFAITCPLPMLLRIYDVILTEGASETLMRVALSLMRRNEKKLLACKELEDAMALLLGRALWDTYGCNADDLVNDFVGLTGLVTRESLESLEKSFKNGSDEDTITKSSSLPTVQAAASRFLGRFWTGASSNVSAKVSSPTSSLGVAAPSRPSSLLHRTPSKQSMASTLNSVESSESHLTTSTDATAMSRNPSADCNPLKPGVSGISNQDRDLHTQIEDLLTALSDMQREQNLLASELQREREEREEDRAAVQRYLEQMSKPTPLDVILEGDLHGSVPSESENFQSDDQEPLYELTARFSSAENNKRSSLMQLSKYQLRQETKLWKDQYEVEAARSADLTRQLADERSENARIVENFREMRSRMQEAHQDKQRLEKTVAELKVRRYSTESDFESVPVTPLDNSPTTSGLRELKLGRSGSLRSNSAATASFAKRTSSLGITKVLATEDHKPPSEDAVLLELVNAKTAEATARQELEEVKGKLDSLRKMLDGGPSSPRNGHKSSPSEPCHNTNPSAIPSSRTAAGPPKLTTQNSFGSGGFFSGWGKRMVSGPAVTVTLTPEA
ncbi:MAG: hypothetical protein Q9163_004929 [Psora crenata]